MNITGSKRTSSHMNVLKKAQEKNESENSPEFIYKVRGQPFALKIVKLPHKEAKK